MSLGLLDGEAAPVLAPPGRDDIDAAITAAGKSIAPLWPLRTFVAVNPFLGFTSQPFEQACAALQRVARVNMLPGAAPAQAVGIPTRPASVATVAEILDRLAGGDRQASLTSFMIDEISRWCAQYFDEGQAVWRAPSRHLGLYAGWKAAMAHDRNAEAMGVTGFRRTVSAAPDDPREAIAAVVAALGIPARAIQDYLFRALFDIRGWAAFARQKNWTAELRGGTDDCLAELLAVRVVWGHALFLAQQSPAFKAAWRDAMRTAARPPLDERPGDDPALAQGLARLDRLEHAYQAPLFEKLTGAPSAGPGARPLLTAAFCIDVRSEPFRRALELVCPGAETLGFAGFFGFPIEYVPLGQTKGGSQCPVLLAPKFIVCEGVKGATEAEEQRVLTLRRLRRRAFKAWKAFKVSAVSSFSFVETAGLVFGAKLVTDAFGLTRPVSHPRSDGIAPSVARRLGPHLRSQTRERRSTGFDAKQRVDMAEAVLTAMSLTSGFARLVLLAGHGSTTVNNPHAAGLDCGACGGHTGEANARVAAAILNDPGVREGLRTRQIDVPADTWFVPALHDTTTDEVTLFDLEDAPATHGADVARLRTWLTEASRHARLQRAVTLGLTRNATVHDAVVERSRDWSQARPEWGLAGCAAFIAAPRDVTRGLDLEGRAFLHNYDWCTDTNFATLELIMTAPLIVASWINLQYYGSTVNNAAFGAGDKVLHNVVGTLGVLEGNGGDLKPGLPLQSLHDGRRFIHEPVRLTAVIAAPVEAIEGVLAKHGKLRELVDNGWLHLFARADTGVISRRERGGSRWRPTDE
ncbi:MAG: DUF2309 domain-containing protein [Acetobacteraceae bacterium]|nr:DUF2309 domain-containing protein [Acetobacteraceae bacterium]